MKTFKISGKNIGLGFPTYIIAEISCNHNGNLDEAIRIVHAAKAGGADAIKLQTFTPDTISRSLKVEAFRVKGTMWEGTHMGDLYHKAMTPWDWHTRLKKEATACGLDWFSSPFDESAVEFLQTLDVPAFKVASFEVVDLPLLRKMAATGRPIIMSTGMTTLSEVDEAVRTLREAGCQELALLHCNSGYPTPFQEVNLATIPVLQQLYDVPIGLSDHSLWADPEEGARRTPMPHIAPSVAVALGARLIEVHLLMDREEAKRLYARGEGGFDWPFSRTPDEFKAMVEAIRGAEHKAPSWRSQIERDCAAAALGTVRTGPTPKELETRRNRPSLMATRAIAAGETIRLQGGGAFPDGNVDSIRPGGGLHTRYGDVVDGAVAVKDIPAGTPLQWDHIVQRASLRRSP